MYPFLRITSRKTKKEPQDTAQEKIFYQADALDASQIVATVDAAEAGIGELHSAKPVVKLPAGFEAVGMISAENVQIMFKLVQDSGR